jgi:hypothetical protein
MMGAHSRNDNAGRISNTTNVALPTNPSLLFSFGIAALVAWRLYSRVRRMVGRQRLSSVRPWITLSVFSLLIALLLLGSIARPPSALAIVGGSVVGAALGVYGIRLTKFEATPAGLFFTPNAWLGIALSLLFLGRLTYRFAQFYSSDDGGGALPSDFMRNPLTLFIFGTLAAYYVIYAIGLIRRGRRLDAGSIAELPERPGS